MIFRLILGLVLGYVVYRVVRKLKEMFTIPGPTQQAPKMPQPDVKRNSLRFTGIPGLIYLPRKNSRQSAVGSLQ